MRDTQPLRSVVAIGMFDGVHTGHRRLLDAVALRARDANLSPAVLTFDVDPEHVLRPDAVVPQLTTLEERLARLRDHGMAHVLTVGFDARLAAMSPEEFVDSIVLAEFDPETVVVGEDFRFGREAMGDVSVLEALGTAHGFEVSSVPLAMDGGRPVSSTRIRRALTSGDVRLAARLLGRPHGVTGTVVAGSGRGRELGFPTANIAPAPEIALPADGVYAAVVHAAGETRPAGVTVGAAPTYPNEAHAGLEAHLLDYSGDLYGETLRVDFHDRLRDQLEFADASALKTAIASDLSQVRRLICLPK